MDTKRVERLKHDKHVKTAVKGMVVAYDHFARVLADEFTCKEEFECLESQLQEVNTINDIIGYLQESLGVDLGISRMMLSDLETDLMEKMERLKAWTKNE